MVDQYGDYVVRLGERIKAIRAAKGISQGKACESAGMSVDTWSRLERGSGQEPKLSTLVRIAQALDVNPAELLPTPSGTTANIDRDNLLVTVANLPEDVQLALLVILSK